MERAAGTGMVSLVREMVLALVDDQAGVNVTGDYANDCVVVNVMVAKSDLGKIIGKQGRTARSLRTILSAASMKYRVRCDLNIDGDQRAGWKG